jgi:cell division inhibitor SepF
MVRATPTSMDDAKLIADRLRRGMPVAMNLEDVDEPMARRVVDFVSGATFALSGTVRKIGRAVFLCSPGGLPVEELASQRRVPGHLFESMEGPAEGSRSWTA